MPNLVYKVLDNSEESALKVENIRGIVYGIADKFDAKESYYTYSIKKGDILVFSCEIEGNTVAVCYVSNSYNSLYIEYLFVLPEFQEKGLHLGRSLLQFVLDNKKLVEEYFNQQFNYSLICPTSKKSQVIYENFGYKLNNKLLNTMRKNI